MGTDVSRHIGYAYFKGCGASLSDNSLRQRKRCQLGSAACLCDGAVWYLNFRLLVT